MAIKAVKGVKDILPDATGKWQKIENIAREIFARFGYREIVLPIFEKSEVFIKSVGETTDIVQKEMYTFTDQGGESLTLRPEGTASCVRAFIEHSMYHPPGSVTALYYFGPMFRRERPQAGRFRQFFQISAELFGVAEPVSDAEVIHLLIMLLKSVGIKEGKLLLNSLGCEVCRPNFKDGLVNFLSEQKESLCELCGERYLINPLRVFDCKNELCGRIIKEAPTIDKFWCSECAEHFSRVRKNLDMLGIEYKLDLMMVRGLDYYTRTVFEVTATGLGAKNSVAGGGRYDTLVKDSGGPDVPAIGFSIGMERLIESLGGALQAEKDTTDVYIVHMGEGAFREAFAIAGRLRDSGIKTLRSNKQAGIKNQMGKANKSGAKLALIIGEDEVNRKAVLLKNLETGEQKEYPIEKIGRAVAKLLDKTE